MTVAEEPALAPTPLMPDIHDSPVLWRSRGEGPAVRADVLDSLKAEMDTLQQQSGRRRELAAAREQAVTELLDLAAGQAEHRWATEHQRSIDEALRALPGGRWEPDGTAVIAIPTAGVNIIDGCLLHPPSGGVQIRWCRSLPDDVIAITSGDQTRRTLLHLAGADLAAKHLKMYQNIRSAGWDRGTAEEICRAIC